MKRVFNVFLAAAISVSAAMTLSSCKDNLDPQPEPAPGAKEFPAPLDHSDIRYPINWTPYTVEQGADGVSIEVTDVTMTDFTFVCRPGSAVKSFKVCAFPLSGIYNYLINLDWSAGISADAVENLLRAYIDEGSSAGSSGYVGGADVYYDVTGDGDNEREFVWSESGYTYVPPVVPDAEYLIIAQAYYEAAAQTEAGISICYVRTKSRQLVGTPDIIIDIEPLYGGIRLNYTPYSSDAAGFYEFTGVKSEIEAYIGEFGERMYLDYIRNMALQSAYPFQGSACPFPMVIPFTEEQAADAMATAVAVDVNGMPGELRTKDVSTKPIPEDAQPATAKVTVDQDHIGSLVFWVNAEMDKYTREVDIHHMTVEEAEKYKNDEAARAELARTLIDEGWVIQNPNFSYNDEIMDATGSGIDDARAYRIDMKGILPDTEYVVAYVAVNYFGETVDVEFTEPFRTDARNITDPSKFNGRFSVEIEDGTSPIGFTVKFTYAPEEVAAYYWQVVSPTEDGQANDMNDRKPWIPGFVGADKPLDYENTTYAEWMNYIFEGIDIFSNPLCNIWFYNWDDLAVNGGTTVDNGDGTVTDKWTFSDMVPGTSYEIIAVPEDWDGNVGPIPEKLFTGTTAALNPGPNPEVHMTVQLNNPDGTGGVTVTFNPVKEVGSMLVMQATTASEISASWSPADLVNGKVKDDGMLNYNDIMSSLRGAVLGDGSEGNTGGLSYYTTTQWPYTGTEPCIIMCIPVGRDGDTPVYGDLLYVIYTGTSYSTNINDFL